MNEINSRVQQPDEPSDRAGAALVQQIILVGNPLDGMMFRFDCI